MPMKKLLGIILYVFVVAGIITGLLVSFRSWLSSPQNSGFVQTAVSVIAGILTILFAGVATLAATESAHSSAKQAAAADRQVEAAKEQIRMSSLQFEEQRKHAESQQRIDQAREIAAYNKFIAEDEVVRPRFACMNQSGSQNGVQFIHGLLELKNVGGGEAIDLTIADTLADSLQEKCPVLRKDEVCSFNLNASILLERCVLCTFTSRMGSQWTIQLQQKSNQLKETVIAIERPYEPKTQ